MKRISIIFCAAFALVAALAMRPAPAAAWFQVCNKTDRQVTVAVVDDWFMGLDDKGWWNIDSGSCAEPISDSIKDDVVYLYAYSSNDTWSGSSYYCVDTQYRFNYEDSQADDSCPTGTKRGFFKVDTGDYTNYTESLTP